MTRSCVNIVPLTSGLFGLILLFIGCIVPQIYDRRSVRVSGDFIITSRRHLLTLATWTVNTSRPHSSSGVLCDLACVVAIVAVHLRLFRMIQIQYFLREILVIQWNAGWFQSDNQGPEHMLARALNWFGTPMENT